MSDEGVVPTKKADWWDELTGKDIVPTREATFWDELMGREIVPTRKATWRDEFFGKVVLTREATSLDELTGKNIILTRKATWQDTFFKKVDNHSSRAPDPPEAQEWSTHDWETPHSGSLESTHDSAGLAAALSLFIPGLGQLLVNRRIVAGLLIFFGCLGLALIIELLEPGNKHKGLTFVLLALWVLNIYDAYWHSKRT